MKDSTGRLRTGARRSSSSVLVRVKYQVLGSAAGKVSSTRESAASGSAREEASAEDNLLKVVEELHTKNNEYPPGVPLPLAPF